MMRSCTWKKSSVVLILAWMSIATTGCGTDPGGLQSYHQSLSGQTYREITWERSARVEVVGDYVNKLIAQERLLPQQILCIFDIDGTLTNYSDPTRFQNWRSGQVPARPGSVQLVKSLYQQGVQLVISSAWPNMQESLDKLSYLNLGTEANIYALGAFETNTFVQRGQSFKYLKKGRTVSVSLAQEDNYVRKALSPLLGLEKSDLDQVKVVLFVDDNVGNIQQFRQDVAQFSPFGSRMERIVYVPLTEVAGN
jgi:hypothetical protein